MQPDNCSGKFLIIFNRLIREDRLCYLSRIQVFSQVQDLTWSRQHAVCGELQLATCRFSPLCGLFPGLVGPGCQLEPDFASGPGPTSRSTGGEVCGNRQPQVSGSGSGVFSSGEPTRGSLPHFLSFTDEKV